MHNLHINELCSHFGVEMENAGERPRSVRYGWRFTYDYREFFGGIFH